MRLGSQGSDAAVDERTTAVATKKSGRKVVLLMCGFELLGDTAPRPNPQNQAREFSPRQPSTARPGWAKPGVTDR